jgi:hypothetical protein
MGPICNSIEIANPKMTGSILNQSRRLKRTASTHATEQLMNIRKSILKLSQRKEARNPQNARECVS